VRRTPLVGSGSWFALAELLKLQVSVQFPDDPAIMKDTQINSEGVLEY
jgi:hypothetical protein